MKAKPTDPFAVRFCERTKTIRKSIGFSQEEMAEALGIPLANYKKYENRTPLPHRLVAKFCLITGAPEGDLFDLDKPVERLPLRVARGAHGQKPS